MTEKRTRTPRLHPYLIELALYEGDEGGGCYQCLVEAHSSTQARAWFNENKLKVREASAREVHQAGVDQVPFFRAVADDCGADPEPDIFGPQNPPQQDHE